MDKMNESPTEIPWSVFAPEEIVMMRAIGERWLNAFRVHVGDARYQGQNQTAKRAIDEHGRSLEPEPTTIAIDVGVVHYWRGLDLRGLLHAPEADFLADMFMIQRFIDRPMMRFPRAIGLKFLAPLAAGNLRKGATR